ncbi:hypothetical protein EBR96_04925 [bacterium]|nr:hypothetical protein [bacterium]
MIFRRIASPESSIVDPSFSLMDRYVKLNRDQLVTEAESDWNQLKENEDAVRDRIADVYTVLVHDRYTALGRVERVSYSHIALDYFDGVRVYKRLDREAGRVIFWVRVHNQEMVFKGVKVDMNMVPGGISLWNEFRLHLAAYETVPGVVAVLTKNLVVLTQGTRPRVESGDTHGEWVGFLMNPVSFTLTELSDQLTHGVNWDDKAMFYRAWRRSFISKQLETTLRNLAVAKIVHRDIHPGNIGIHCDARNLDVKKISLVLMDFGRAASAKRLVDHRKVTKTRSDTDVYGIDRTSLFELIFPAIKQIDELLNLQTKS